MHEPRIEQQCEPIFEGDDLSNIQLHTSKSK